MFIPNHHLKRLEKAHRLGHQAHLPAGFTEGQVEPLEVGIAVENHRWAWKPAKVRIVLIAESHVYTTREDVALKVLRDRLPEEARNTPEEFVRLVYCLGYGESEVLTPTQPKSNLGTSDYWELFGELAGTLPSRQSKAQQTLDERLAWKVETLKALQDKGVWLLDSSLHGIYGLKAIGKPTRMPAALAGQLHEIWWNEYGGSIVDEIDPEGIWLVGKDVVKAFQKLEVPFTGWIYQPGAQKTASYSRASLDELLASVHPSPTESTP